MTETDMRDGKRKAMPFRAYAGALLGAVVIAAAVGFAHIGAIEAPQDQDFRFTRGTTFAPGEDTALRGYLADIAMDDRIVLRITGHTGTRGDDTANVNLSNGRAAAAQKIALDLGISPSRILWVGGVGGAAPLPRDPDISEREWESDLSRVTIESVVRP